jgi:hypothetical protein
LNKDNLSHYDGLIIYANHDSISKSQEEALLDYVRGGKVDSPSLRLFVSGIQMK